MLQIAVRLIACCRIRDCRIDCSVPRCIRGAGQTGQLRPPNNFRAQHSCHGPFFFLVCLSPTPAGIISTVHCHAHLPTPESLYLCNPHQLRRCSSLATSPGAANGAIGMQSSGGSHDKENAEAQRNEVAPPSGMASGGRRHGWLAPGSPARWAPSGPSAATAPTPDWIAAPAATCRQQQPTTAAPAVDAGATATPGH